MTACFPKHLAKVLGPEGDVRRGSSLINASEVSVPWKGIENYRKVQHISWIFNDVHAVSRDFTLPTSSNSHGSSHRGCRILAITTWSRLELPLWFDSDFAARCAPGFRRPAWPAPECWSHTHTHHAHICRPDSVFHILPPPCPNPERWWARNCRKTGRGWDTCLILLAHFPAPSFGS